MWISAALVAVGGTACFVWYCRGPARFEAVADVRDLIGASPSQIGTLLGEPKDVRQLPYGGYGHGWRASYRARTGAAGIVVAYRPGPSPGADAAGIVWVGFRPFPRRPAMNPQECCQLVGLPETIGDLGGRADGPWVAVRPVEGIHLLMCNIDDSGTDIVAFETQADVEACPVLDLYEFFSRRMPGDE